MSSKNTWVTHLESVTGTVRYAISDVEIEIYAPYTEDMLPSVEDIYTKCVNAAANGHFSCDIIAVTEEYWGIMARVYFVFKKTGAVVDSVMPTC